VNVRVLGADDLPALRALVDRDPIRHCFVAARLDLRLGVEFIGYFDDSGLHSCVYVGANLIPIETSPQSRAAFADWLRRRPRRCSSFVGADVEVLDLWRLLEPAWGAAREVRSSQPLMAMNDDPLIAADPKVRPATAADLELVLPACVHMFTEEVGVAPYRPGGEHAYRGRICDVIEAGHAFVRIEDDVVLFKAEIGSATDSACQVQGVWVNPVLRGRGLAAPGMAAVVELARSTIAPAVSLYVNDYNVAARKAYARVGFEERARFATVLF
jgi:predicted GNAT family acetyltransferase